jgi:hypothetical protein
MDWFEKCIERTKDSQFCEHIRQAGELADSLFGCVMKKKDKECFEECLRRCKGERCGEVCAGALEVALGALAAKDLAERAVAAAILGISPLDAAAMAFNAKLRRVEEEECPGKAFTARVLAATVTTLYMGLKEAPALQEDAQEVLMLLAPALAVLYQCVGEDAHENLEMMRPFIGEAAERIAATMEEGIVNVGNVFIRFKPAKQ